MSPSIHYFHIIRQYKQSIRNCPFALWDNPSCNCEYVCPPNPTFCIHWADCRGDSCKRGRTANSCDVAARKRSPDGETIERF